MQEYVDKALCDQRYEMVKDTNEKVTKMAVDMKGLKTAFDIHIKTHERSWMHTAKIIGLMIALAGVVAFVVVAFTK